MQGGTGTPGLPARDCAGSKTDAASYGSSKAPVFRLRFPAECQPFHPTPGITEADLACVVAAPLVEDVLNVALSPAELPYEGLLRLHRYHDVVGSLEYESGNPVSRKAGAVFPKYPVDLRVRFRQSVSQEGVGEIRAEKLSRRPGVILLHPPNALAGDVFPQALGPTGQENPAGFETIATVDRRVGVDYHGRDNRELPEEGLHVGRGAIPDDTGYPDVRRVRVSKVGCPECGVTAVRESCDEHRGARNHGAAGLFEKISGSSDRIEHHPPFRHGDAVRMEVRRITEAHVVGQHADRSLADMGQYMGTIEPPVDARDMLTRRATGIDETSRPGSENIHRPLSSFRIAGDEHLRGDGGRRPVRPGAFESQEVAVNRVPCPGRRDVLEKLRYDAIDVRGSQGLNAFHVDYLSRLRVQHPCCGHKKYQQHQGRWTTGNAEWGGDRHRV